MSDTDDAPAPSMIDLPYVHRHIRTYEGGILEQESLDLIERYDQRLLRYIQG